MQKFFQKDRVLFMLCAAFLMVEPAFAAGGTNGIIYFNQRRCYHHHHCHYVGRLQDRIWWRNVPRNGASFNRRRIGWLGGLDCRAIDGVLMHLPLSIYVGFHYLFIENPTF